MKDVPEIFLEWRDIATAPEFTEILVRSNDGTYLAERQGSEWVPSCYVPEENPAPPRMWAAAPILTRPRDVEDSLGWLEESDREMIVESYEGGEQPERLDREFLEEGIFAPCLVPWFNLGASQHVPSGYSVGFKLTEYGEKVAEAIIAAEGDDA